MYWAIEKDSQEINTLVLLQILLKSRIKMEMKLTNLTIFSGVTAGGMNQKGTGIASI